MKYCKKTICILLCFAMIFSLAACSNKNDTTAEQPETTTAVAKPVYTASPSSVSKSETVYANLDYSGKVTQINVTDWLHTDVGKVKVDDISDLTDIVNVKGDEVPDINGKSIVWNMTGTDLYYSGESQKKLPVSVSIEYYLNGKKVSAEDLKGKNGEIEIKINMKNELYTETEINGVKRKIYLPMLVAGGCIMPEGNFSAVSVTNGKAIGDGTKEIAVVFGMPGMSESLGLDTLGITDIEGISIVSSASIKANATNFSLGNMYFAAIPLGSLNLNLVSDNMQGDLHEIISILKSVQNAISSVDADELISSFQKGSASSLLSAASDAVKLYQSNKALLSLLQKYSDSESKKQLDRLLKVLTSENSIKAISILSNSSVIKFFEDLSTVTDDMPILVSLISDFKDPKVQKAVENLPQTLKQLSALQKTLDENSSLLTSLSSLLEGDGLDAVSSLINTLGNGDMAKYVSESSGNVNIVDYTEAWIEYGKQYKIYTDTSKNMTTSVIFVLMTPGIG